MKPVAGDDSKKIADSLTTLKSSLIELSKTLEGIGVKPGAVKQPTIGETKEAPVAIKQPPAAPEAGQAAVSEAKKPETDADKLIYLESAADEKNVGEQVDKASYLLYDFIRQLTVESNIDPTSENKDPDLAVDQEVVAGLVGEEEQDAKEGEEQQKQEPAQAKGGKQ